MTIYLVRHAYSRHNAPDPSDFPYDYRVAESEGRDPSLSPMGIEQANCLGARLKDIQIDYVLCSPAHRTIRTAIGAISQKKEKPALELMQELIEYGLPKEMTFAPLNIMEDMYPGHVFTKIPNVLDSRLYETSDAAGYARAKYIRDYVLNRFGPDDNILIVSHGAFCSRFLISAILGLPFETIGKTKFGAFNASLSTFVVAADGTEVRGRHINETSYLGEWGKYNA